MKEIFSQWKYTKMIALTGLSGALYAALTIPLKGVQLAPGIEFRISDAVPPITSILFGPAGAWGAGLGNLVADFFGTMGLASLFGVVAKLLFGFTTYKIWYSSPFITSENEPLINTWKKGLKLILALVLSAFTMATLLSFTISGVFGFAPYGVIAPIFFSSGIVAPVILTVPLLNALYPRIKKWGLFWLDVMEPEDISKPRSIAWGHILAWGGMVGAFAVGEYLAIARDINVGNTIWMTLLPLIVVGVIGLALLGVPEKDLRQE